MENMENQEQQFRYRPKSDYLMQATWQELYKLAEHWKSELQFYADELRFFGKLVSSYDGSSDPELVQVNRMIKDAGIQLKSISSQTEEHLKHIGQVLTGKSPGQDMLFREEHNVLEDNIAAFIQAVRNLRIKLFSEIEEYI
jgi:hypothetical protein